MEVCQRTRLFPKNDSFPSIQGLILTDHFLVPLVVIAQMTQRFVCHMTSIDRLCELVENEILRSRSETVIVFATDSQVVHTLASLSKCVSIVNPKALPSTGVSVSALWIWCCDVPLEFVVTTWNTCRQWQACPMHEEVIFIHITV